MSENIKSHYIRTDCQSQANSRVSRLFKKSLNVYFVEKFFKIFFIPYIGSYKKSMHNMWIKTYVLF